jgi:NAD(P)-dependent dehydrogenase (short-subunit alcohol dehydrogenase family)
LAHQGCNIVLNGSRPQDQVTLVDEIQNEHNVKGFFLSHLLVNIIQVAYAQADFSEPEIAASVVIKTAVETFGTVHILGNLQNTIHLPFSQQRWHTTRKPCRYLPNRDVEQSDECQS